MSASGINGHHEPLYAGLERQARMVAARQISARELVEACLAQIASVDQKLNAFRVVFPEEALVAADAAQKRLQAGDAAPLLGVPIAIKDDTDVAGAETTCGTGAHGPPATRDAEVVRRLREAGAIVIGKTNEPELGAFPFTESKTWGVTRNPWDPTRTPGGSSGGSAVAVATGMAGAALGTDGGGSIRIPAACCGVFGIKPQRGRISMAPRRDHWHGMTVIGPLARRVADAALFLDATAAAAPPIPFVEAAHRAPGQLRIAVSSAFPPGLGALRGLDAACSAVLADVAEALRGLGHTVTPRDPDYGRATAQLVPRYLRGVHDDARELAHPERLERRTRQLARLGGLIPPAILARVLGDERRVADRLAVLFADHEVLMTPAVASPALPVDLFAGRGALSTALRSGPLGMYTTPWNVTGQPAAAVPSGFTEAGLPLAVQLVGRPGCEATLLALAAQLEAERPWADRLPPPLRV